MKIKTITCHNVYNVGASLQAYAFSKYLQEMGHEVEIINYTPKYLRHYRLTGVNNPAYDKPVLREVYQILKFPGRVAARFSKRKKVFDSFTKKYLPVTAQSYETNESLKAADLNANLVLAGSDQIWNPLFQNGKDPAFFLDFVSGETKKASYAASFAVETLPKEDQIRMKKYLSDFDAISVRESSGLRFLEEMGLSGSLVCDPVLLIDKEDWKNLMSEFDENDYLFVYDFDGSDKVKAMAEAIAGEQGKKIVSVFPMEGANRVCKDMGPLEFLGAIEKANVVLSNSFHATVFSLIFHKEFFVVDREEKINTRMRDLLRYVGLETRMIGSETESKEAEPIDWEQVDDRLRKLVGQSKNFLEKLTGEV